MQNYRDHEEELPAHWSTPDWFKNTHCRQGDQRFAVSTEFGSAEAEDEARCVFKIPVQAQSLSIGMSPALRVGSRAHYSIECVSCDGKRVLTGEGNLKTGNDYLALPMPRWVGKTRLHIELKTAEHSPPYLLVLVPEQGMDCN